MSGAVPVGVLLGLFDTGLAVLRTLARVGLPATEPEALVRFLREHAAHPGGNGISSPTSGRGQQ